jgi:alpha-farnesene synthase
MDETTGLFRKSTHANIKEMLQLLEASHLAFEGENILDEARDFSTATLKETISNNLGSDLTEQVAHVLELPSQRRVQWFEVKWHINVYEKDTHMNPILLQLAKLHFNIVQATLQTDLRDSSRYIANKESNFYIYILQNSTTNYLQKRIDVRINVIYVITSTHNK